MRNLKEQRREHAVALRLRGENSLRDVSAAARLRTRIPRRPPLNREEYAEREDWHPRVGVDSVRRRSDTGRTDIAASPRSEMRASPVFSAAMPPTARTE